MSRTRAKRLLLKLIRNSIINPIAHYRDDELSRDVNEFLRQHILRTPPEQPIQDSDDLAQVELFQKAAKVARNPQSSSTLAELTEDDRAALQQERKLSFKQPWKLWLTLATCSFGALTQGWSQTGINGANIGWANELGLKKSDGGARYDWLFGMVNAGCYLAGQHLSKSLCLFYGFLFATDLKG